MKIDDVINALKELKIHHGNIDVKFDCPFCSKTTCPDYIIAVKHITMRKKD